MKKNTAAACFVSCLTLLLTACSELHIRYASDSIEALLVDGDTWEPVAGANVVAKWQLKGGLEGGNVVGQAMVLETVSDEKGRFYFPAWGPTPSRSGTLEIQSAPVILVYKPGYYLRELRISSSAWKWHRPGFVFFAPRISTEWINGKTHVMTKFEGDLKAYRRNLGYIDSFLSQIVYHCHWDKIPQILFALVEQNKFFEQHGVSGLPRTIAEEKHLSEDDRWFTRKCGKSPAKFFENYKLQEK